MKTCRGCGKEKRQSEFVADRRKDDGRSDICRSCKKAERRKAEQDVTTELGFHKAVEQFDLSTIKTPKVKHYRKGGWFINHGGREIRVDNGSPVKIGAVTHKPKYRRSNIPPEIAAACTPPSEIRECQPVSTW